MRSTLGFIEAKLAAGRAYFTHADISRELGLPPLALQKALYRLKEKGTIVSPRRHFYLILKPEDRAIGAPDPAKWIDPLMRHLGTDYRISLLRAAAFHGASHQAAMIFQVIVPRQLPKIDLGRWNVAFLFQAPYTFVQTNRAEWLKKIKTESGYAQIAGVELTLLDACRYFHHSGGLNGAAQIAHDLGKEANPQKLAKVAAMYENSAVRRLGYLLEHFGHFRQAMALRPFADKAKSFKPMDPSANPLVGELAQTPEKNHAWKLSLNTSIEIDQ